MFHICHSVTAIPAQLGETFAVVLDRLETDCKAGAKILDLAQKGDNLIEESVSLNLRNG